MEDKIKIVLFRDQGGLVYDKFGNYLCVVTPGNYDEPSDESMQVMFDQARAEAVKDLISRGISVDDVIKLKTSGLL